MAVCLSQRSKPPRLVSNGNERPVPQHWFTGRAIEERGRSMMMAPEKARAEDSEGHCPPNLKFRLKRASSIKRQEMGRWDGCRDIVVAT